MKNNMRIAGLSLVAALFCAQAGATTITTTTFSGWNSSLSGSPTEADFSPISFSNYNTANGITLNGIADPSSTFTFTGPDNGGYQLSGTSYGGYTGLEGSADSGAGINVALPTAGENAFLVYAVSTTGSPLSLTLSDGENFTLSNGFNGVSISHPVTSFFLSTTAGSQVVVDDFWYGQSSLTQDGSGSSSGSGSGGASAAPEGATLLMVCGGALVLFGTKRKVFTAFHA